MTNALVPFVHVADVPRSIDFYTKLGFTVGNTVVPEGETDPVWAWLESGKARLMVARADGPIDHRQQAVLFYTYCSDIREAHRALAESGVGVGPIRKQFYAPDGEFRMEDPDGYVVMMMQAEV